MSGESEFGKGLTICLVKFAEHIGRWPGYKKNYEEMKVKHPDLFTKSGAVEMYFNGASDHLYEIEVPANLVGTKLGNKVEELKSFGLEIGHHFKHDRKYTEADIDKAHDMTREIALMIDRWIGLSPELGQW